MPKPNSNIFALALSRSVYFQTPEAAVSSLQEQHAEESPSPAWSSSFENHVMQCSVERMGYMQAQKADQEDVSAWMTGIVEVPLSVAHKLKSIEETEAAKKRLLEQLRAAPFG